MVAVGDHYMNGTPDLIKRASCAFGGGVAGCRKELCGLVSGATLVLSAMYGRTDVTQDDARLKEMVCAYRDRFITQFGSSICEPVRDQQPEGQKRCGGVVRIGTRMLVELIEEYQAK